MGVLANVATGNWRPTTSTVLRRAPSRWPGQPPGAGEAFVARGRVTKAGRTLSFVTADVFAIRGGEERLIATMQGTMMTVLDRPGLSG